VGHPEGHPKVVEHVLAGALDAKVSFARRNGLDLTIVTQFCLEARPIVEWLKGIRSRGIDVPVRIGLAGPAGLITLTRYAIRCGVGNSLKVLTANPAFAKLLVDQGPEPIVRELAASVGLGSTASPPLGIAGLHFFVFGGFSKTMDWIDARQTG
jgi:methylenetetrahydrofolate reductase (NADPH)